MTTIDAGVQTKRLREELESLQIQLDYFQTVEAGYHDLRPLEHRIKEIEKELEHTPPTPEELRQRVYAAVVDVCAYDSLYVTCVKTPPSLLFSDVIPELETMIPRKVLEQVDPATPCCEILSRNVVAQSLKDACNTMIDSVNATDLWSKQMVLHRYLRPEQPLTDDTYRRVFEIMRDIILNSKRAVDCKKMSDEELHEFDAWRNAEFK